MRKILIKYLFILFSLFIFVNAFSNDRKNILCINSYHVGYHWSDSIVSGITQSFETHPEYTLHIEYLDSKKQGQSNFEIYKTYFKEKYVQIKFNGIIVTDNDALDFAIKYGEALFPKIPVTFCGISDPEDYNLEDTRFYGVLENNDPEIIINTIQKLLPSCRRILILTDNTTAGIVYKKEYQAIKSKYAEITLGFIDNINPTSIIDQINSGQWDAVFMHSLDVDMFGNLINYYELAEKIVSSCQIPFFTSNELLAGKGFIGGPIIKGKNQGKDVASLMIDLVELQKPYPSTHIFKSKIDYIFDKNVMDRYNIPISNTPSNSIIINNEPIKNLKSILILSGASVLLLIIVVILTLNINKRTKAEHKIKEHLSEIKTQHIQLEEAFDQLNKMMANMETINTQLKLSNQQLLEAKKKAEESDALKSAFLANVSHEIRTPLNAIVGFSSLLEDESLDEITKNEFIGYISTNTATLLILIDQILDLSRIEADQLEVQKDWFDVSSLLAETKEFQFSDGKSPDVELIISNLVHGKKLFIKSDKLRITQIFRNLLSNSYKFTEKGEVEVGAYIEDQRGAVFYIKDSGIGIDPEFQDKIFDRFRKIDSTSGKVYRGTGLGLSITKKLVELLGGKIWLDTNYKEGSAFYFTQPDYYLE